jgi:putative hydrolase of the HAD superfamily
VIEAIAFDLDNTLVDRQAAMAAFVDHWLFERCGVVAPEERQVMVERAMVMDNGGEGDRDAFYRWFVDEYGPSSFGPDQFGAEVIRRIAGFVSPQVEVQRVLRVLAKTFRLALVTNGSSVNQRKKLKNAGLDGFFSFEGVFVSQEVGVAKPSPGIFLAAREWLGCPSSKVLFVGDSLKNDVAGAAAVSMKTCWIAGSRPLSLGHAADWTLLTVVGLPGLLGLRLG